jgi:hypothetical protein
MNYTIEIYSRGIDVGIGKVTKEQYEYWSERPAGDLDDVMNSNFDYEENETPEEAKMEREYYNEYEDVFFGFGPDANYHEMTIKDENGNVVFEGDTSGYIDAYDPDYEVDLTDNGDQDYYSQYLEPGYYVQWCQGGKGLYYETDFEADTFDPLKIKFSVRETDYGEIITGISYDGEELYNNAGDYDIKSFEAHIFTTV